jgi:glycine cleavage system aminomethyltransferase T
LSPGAELVSSGKQVGRVTSAAHSPRAGAIGLALVRREESQAGATVQVTVDGETVGEARVVPLHETGG